MFAGMSGGDFLPKVTVSGKPGSGTSTLVDLLAKDMGWDSVNGEDIFRQEAKRLNLSVEEFSRLCKENFEVDRSLDDMLKNLISSENGPFIVESRLSGWWAYLEGIDCLRVWVEVSDKERANRIMAREGGDFESVHLSALQRNSDDTSRYKMLYDIDLDDMAPYNFIIKADSLSPSEVLEAVKKQLEGKYV